MSGASRDPHMCGARRIDVTLAGETNLDVLPYGLAEHLPFEPELLANDIAVRPADRVQSPYTTWPRWATSTVSLPQ